MIDRHLDAKKKHSSVVERVCNLSLFFISYFFYLQLIKKQAIYQGKMADFKVNNLKTIRITNAAISTSGLVRLNSP